jgi:hypothetical protein
MADLAALRAEFLARGFDGIDASGTTRQDGYLNRAYTEIVDGEDWPFLTKAVSSTAPIAIADLRTIESVVNTTQKYKLTPLDRRHITDSDTDVTTVGTPSVYYLTPVAGEVQTITIDAGGGTFTASFAGETTAATSYIATTATLQANLIALANLNTGDVVVTGSTGGPYTITFGGNYANVDVPPITTNAASLTGGAGTATVTQTLGGYYVNVYPANTTDTIQVRYWFVPPALAADVDAPIIPPRYHPLIVDGAVAYAYLSADNAEGYASYKQIFEDGKRMMREALLVQQHDRPSNFITITAGSQDW